MEHFKVFTLEFFIQERCAFVEHVFQFYASQKRILPWRECPSDYYVFISEIMLQQTQVARVLNLFDLWVKKFPTFEALAHATTQEVLTMWKGLGYNRRALWLHSAARDIVKLYGSKLPCDKHVLTNFKGIGENTAAAMINYTYNKAMPFIETNIRSVFIASWFYNQENIPDSSLLSLIEQTWSQENPREWGYALMDYGTYIKKIITNPSRKSSHYVQQSKFEGSFRQLRARLLHFIVEKKSVDYLCLEESFSDLRLLKALDSLVNDGFISRFDDKFEMS